MSEPSRRVVVVGDLLYDMIAAVGDGVSFGSDTFTSIHASPGGSAANVASHLARLGVETDFVGRVGDDAFGSFLAGEMEKVGVRTRLSRDRKLATGKVFVMVDESGERTMITDRGASEALCVDDLSESDFRRGSHLHLTGYSFSGGSRREAAKEALRLASEAEMSVSVDPSSVTLLEDVGGERFLGWTSGAHLCFPNLEEGALLSGCREPERIVEGLLEYYSCVVLKLGAGGALCAGKSGEKFHSSAGEARAVDTTGAGDAFCAGFLSGWLSGEGFGTSLEKGTRLAGEVVGGFGGTFSGGSGQNTRRHVGF